MEIFVCIIANYCKHALHTQQPHRGNLCIFQFFSDPSSGRAGKPMPRTFFKVFQPSCIYFLFEFYLSASVQVRAKHKKNQRFSPCQCHSWSHFVVRDARRRETKLWDPQRSQTQSRLSIAVRSRGVTCLFTPSSHQTHTHTHLKMASHLSAFIALACVLLAGVHGQGMLVSLEEVRVQMMK